MAAAVVAAEEEGGRDPNARSYSHRKADPDEAPATHSRPHPEPKGQSDISDR